ncbi:MAG: PrsW family glutamic-type intramembrane protease [Bacillota bacterium]|nr:PrsW family glutamic-type intramembrane protease [Bacillota bacterium]
MLLLLVVSLVPGLLWVWFFYRQDRYEAEPRWLVIRAFWYGLLAVFPAALIESYFQPFLHRPDSLVRLFLFTTAGVGLVEEVAKFTAAYLAVGSSPHFNEPMDGIVYTVAAGLGFAALENLFYTQVFGWGVAPVRAVATSLAHASFSGIAGFYWGLGLLDAARTRRFLARGLLYAVWWHGLYDWLVLGRLVSPGLTLALLFVIVAHLWIRIRTARRLSPFRPRPPEDGPLGS